MKPIKRFITESNLYQGERYPMPSGFHQLEFYGYCSQRYVRDSYVGMPIKTGVIQRAKYIPIIPTELENRMLGIDYLQQGAVSSHINFYSW